MGEGSVSSNNRRLRDLVMRSRLNDAVALTLFNRGLGSRACTASQWKSFLEEPGSPRHSALPDHLLAHAETQLAPLVTS